MQEAVRRARARPTEVIEIAAAAQSRHEAAAGLAELLDIDASLADQVLDIQVSDFVGQLPAKS